MEQIKNAFLKNTDKNHPAFHLFLYLLSFLAGGFVVSGIIGTYHQLINKFIKEDELLERMTSQVDQSSAKFFIAALLVAIPVYFSILWFVNKKLEKQEIPKDSLIRKIATYLALFIFSALGIGSLVALIFSYLDGGLTLRFALKALVFLITATFFFAFYLWEIRRIDFKEIFFKKWFFASLLLASSALVAGFLTIDSPGVTRAKKLDLQILEEVNNFANRLDNYYQEKKQLPETDNEILKDLDKKVSYEKISQKDYRLCAEFKYSSRENNYSGFSMYYYPEKELWNHPAGKYCFEKTVTDLGQDQKIQ